VVDAKQYKVRLWDTGGNEKFRTVTSSYYRGAHLALLCFDITDRVSWTNLRSWIGECDRYCQQTTAIAVLGLKSDLDAKRIVEQQEIKEFCESSNYRYLEVSSKLGTNVDKSLEYFLDPVVKILPSTKNAKEPEQTVSLMDKFTFAFNSLFKPKKKQEKVEADTGALELVVNGKKADILEEIGVGGTSHVFKANWNGNNVAVKVFRTDDNAIKAAEKELKILKYFLNKKILKIAEDYDTQTSSNFMALATSKNNCVFC
jgi:small GTP-binding protein